MKVRKITGLDKEDILTRLSYDEVPEDFRDEVWVKYDEDENPVDTLYVNTKTGRVLTAYDGYLCGGYSQLREMEK